MGGPAGGGGNVREVVGVMAEDLGLWELLWRLLYRKASDRAVPGLGSHSSIGFRKRSFLLEMCMTFPPCRVVVRTREAKARKGNQPLPAPQDSPTRSGCVTFSQGTEPLSTAAWRGGLRVDT